MGKEFTYHPTLFLPFEINSNHKAQHILSFVVRPDLTSHDTDGSRLKIRVEQRHLAEGRIWLRRR